MEFLVEVSGHELESSQILVFVWFFYHRFSVLQNATHEKRLAFSCFADIFLYGILKPEYCMISVNPPVDGTVNSKILKSFVKWMSMNYISGLYTFSRLFIQQVFRIGYPVEQRWAK